MHVPLDGRSQRHWDAEPLLQAASEPAPRWLLSEPRRRQKKVSVFLFPAFLHVPQTLARCLETLVEMLHGHANHRQHCKSYVNFIAKLQSPDVSREYGTHQGKVWARACGG